MIKRKRYYGDVAGDRYIEIRQETEEQIIFRSCNGYNRTLEDEEAFSKSDFLHFFHKVLRYERMGREMYSISGSIFCECFINPNQTLSFSTLGFAVDGNFLVIGMGYCSWDFQDPSIEFESKDEAFKFARQVIEDFR